VATRTKGRRLTDDIYEHCEDFTTNATCSGCAQCQWDDLWDRCEVPECKGYTDQTACCANAKKIPTGCSWQADAGTSGQCNPKTCDGVTDNTCDGSGFNEECDKASEVCGTFSACQYTCMGCQDGGQECSEENGACMCGAADLGEALGDAFGSMNCPMMECSSCLKDPDTTSQLTLEEMQARRESECSPKCDNIVHCDSEVECLMGSGSGSSSSDTVATCNTLVHTPQASCDTTIVKPTGPSTGGVCGDQCADFEQKCEARGKSCGAVSSCPETSAAATQGMASCMKVLLLLASPLAMGTIY